MVKTQTIHPVRVHKRSLSGEKRTRESESKSVRTTRSASRIHTRSQGQLSTRYSKGLPQKATCKRRLTSATFRKGSALTPTHGESSSNEAGEVLPSVSVKDAAELLLQCTRMDTPVPKRLIAVVGTERTEKTKKSPLKGFVTQHLAAEPSSHNPPDMQQTDSFSPLVDSAQAFMKPSDVPQVNDLLVLATKAANLSLLTDIIITLLSERAPGTSRGHAESPSAKPTRDKYSGTKVKYLEKKLFPGMGDKSAGCVQAEISCTGEMINTMQATFRYNLLINCTFF